MTSETLSFIVTVFFCLIFYGLGIIQGYYIRKSQEGIDKNE